MSILSRSHSHSHSLTHSHSLSRQSHCQLFVVMIWSHTIHALYVYRYTLYVLRYSFGVLLFFGTPFSLILTQCAHFRKYAHSNFVFFSLSLPTRASSIESKQNETKRNVLIRKTIIFIYLYNKHTTNICMYFALFFYSLLLCRFSSCRS